MEKILLSLLALVCLSSIELAYASTLTLNDCQGFSIAARTLEDGEKTSFTVAVIQDPSDGVAGSVALRVFGDAKTTQIDSPIENARAHFQNVEANTYQLCASGKAKLGEVTFWKSNAAAASPILLGVIGVGGVVAVSEAARSSGDGSGNDVLGPEVIPTPTPVPVTPEPSKPGGVSGVGCPPKGSSGGGGVSTSGNDGCGTDLNPPPLSPYN